MQKLGQLAFNRLQILGLIKAGTHVESNKEQLREIEKQMVILGWDGKAHTVIQTKGGLVIKSKPKRDGHIIRIKPFKLGAFINKYF